MNLQAYSETEQKTFLPSANSHLEDIDLNSPLIYPEFPVNQGMIKFVQYFQ